MHTKIITILAILLLAIPTSAISISEYLYPEDSIIEVEVEPINMTEIPYTTNYTITNLSTVTDFMENCPIYEGNGQCVSCSRYLVFQAKEHNLTLSTCIIGGQGSAERTEKHQIVTFKDNGIRYFSPNINKFDRRILTYNDMLDVFNGRDITTKISHLNARDYWTL